MEVKLSPKIKREVFDVLKEYGYGSEKDFIEDALRHRILELKMVDFLYRVEEIRKIMKKKKDSGRRYLKRF